MTGSRFRLRARGLAALAVAGLALVAGCASSAASPAAGTRAAGTPAGTTASASDRAPGSDRLSGSITVLAAASLTGTFTTVGKQFEAAHPGTTVTFSFGASSALSAQVLAGAPADVFASANTSTMDSVVGGSATAGTPQTFATNTLELAVPPGNPGHVTGLADLAEDSLRIALCAPAVPCGSAATKLLAQAHIEAKPDTLEDDVKATLAKVELKEVDAALVYRTDVAAAGNRVMGIDVPEAATVVNSYPIATLTGSSNAALAEAFVDYVLSPSGQSVLSQAGFGSP